MGRKKQNIPRELNYHIGRTLLDIVKLGRLCFDGNGEPVMGADGKQLRRQATAADLQAATKWLESTGYFARRLQEEGEESSTMSAWLKARAEAGPLRFNPDAEDEADGAQAIS